MTREYGVKNNYIFGIPNPDLPIHYATFIGLRRRLRVVFANAKALDCVNFLCVTLTFDLEQFSYMAGHVTNLATKLEDPTPIRS